MSENDGKPTTPAGGDESGFTPIQTQAELDAALKERLDRERKKFADYNDLKQKAEAYDKLEADKLTETQKLTKRIDELTNKLSEREQADQKAAWKKAAAEKYGVAENVLRGTTEDEINAHAEELQALIKPAGDDEEKPQRRRLEVPGDGGKTPETPGLNSDKLLNSLKAAVGAE